MYKPIGQKERHLSVVASPTNRRRFYWEKFMSAEKWVHGSLHSDGILELKLARAPVNALSPQFLNFFGKTVASAALDETVRAIIIRSSFNVFSGGIDLKAAKDYDIDAQNSIVAALNNDFLTLYAVPKPVVVAVSGAAIAGGLFFVLAADYRIATPKAKLGLAEIRVGVKFPIGPLEMARATLPSDYLRRMMLTGEPIGAEEAHRIGIIDELSGPETLLDDALRAARSLAEAPSGNYAVIKEQLKGETIAKIKAGIASGIDHYPSGWFDDIARARIIKMLGS